MAEIEERAMNGYIPSPEDDRDYTIDMVMAADNEELPASYRTEGNVPVLNQGINSDCVAHAIAVAIAYGECKLNSNKFNNYSRGFIYGNRRPTDIQTEGMIIRQALKQVNHDGDCLYTVFPYQGKYKVMKETIAEKAEEYMKAAEPYKILNYFRLYNEREIKKAIMNNGAVILGMTTYDSFGTYIKLPDEKAKKRGGHAMCCVGWNEQGWIIQNSWGKLWGDKGYCYLPYDYPVDEWWGISVSKESPKPEKDSFFKRFIGLLKSFWNLLKNFFHR